ncbi:uncharacterized protein [Lepeophtheirus salmonis]|uniref:uncharacterized protein n=1 Tax=Lepeophtheirus salmonis TaxID=72036 RepID=UPI001AE9628C|nr:proteoglycan 4-like [Lepeophtheirus salmonis]
MIEYAVPLFGRIVVIKKSGCDGSIFPLWNKECLIGRHEDCDIRIQLADVSAQHARVSVAEDSKVYIESLGRNGVRVNGTRVIEGAVLLKHKDVFEISDRSFRFEYPADHSSGSPGAGASEPRKRVSFGPMISPEYIDKSLPPSTPIKKGALPDVVPGTPLSHMKRRFRRKVAATPQHDSILETNEEPVGVLVRHDNDTPLVKESSGFRTSPRTSNEEKKSDVENFITSPAPSPQKKSKYSKDTVATRKKTPEKTPRKKSLTLSKKPSNFYGASAAKTPRGAKKPLPKTPKKIALKTPKKTTLKTPKKATLKTPKKRTPKTPKKATPKKTTSKTPKKVIAKTPRKISSKVIKTTEKLTKSGKKSSATSWADVLKKNVGKTPKATKVARESRLALEKARMQIGKKKRTKKSYLTKKTSIKASKYRHAESPEDIVIHRRGSHSNLRIISSPSKSLKKGRKSLKLVSQSSTSRVEEDIVSSPSRSFTKSKSPSSVVKKLRNEKSSDSPRKSSKKT